MPRLVIIIFNELYIMQTWYFIFLYIISLNLVCIYTKCVHIYACKIIIMHVTEVYSYAY